MRTKLLITFFLSTALFFSACGDGSEGEAKLGIQQMLDDGDYAGVISLLESGANSTDDYLALGAAYMGKAGLSLTSIISSVTSAGDSNSTFAGFASSVATKSTSTALTDLGKSTTFYQKVVSSKCTEVNATLSDSEKDICLFIGLVSTTKAAVTIDLISSDISTFGSGSNSSDDKLSASTCAMNYAFNRTNSSDCNITESSDVNFTVINKLYKPLLVTVSAKQFHYLMNDTNQTVLTKGFCLATDFSTRVDGNFTDSYACPINETPNAQESTTAGVLVDVLNNGLGAIGGAASAETQADIDEFKCELLDGNYTNSTCSKSLDSNVSEQSIINYLNNNNN